MKILEHFDRTNAATHILYQLKKGEWGNLIGKLPVEFRKCYITDRVLEDLSDNNGISKSDFLEKYIIPDRGNIVSGDFGEIVSYYAVKDNYQIKGINISGPKKWQWKHDKNKPVQGADAILFHIANPKKPTKKDILVSIESKMKAVASTDHRIQDAIIGASKDKKSRMAKTLSWLEERYAKDGEKDKIKSIERFKDPATHGDYQKEFKAIAIVDKSLETGETGKAFTNIDNVCVIVFSIEDLKKAYEDTRINIINSV